MIYLFYTALGLAAVISIGTIKAQIAHIKGLKGMYKEESRKAHALQLEVDAMRLQIYQAEQFMHRVREQKRRCERKRREAKNAASKN